MRFGIVLFCKDIVLGVHRSTVSFWVVAHNNVRTCCFANMMYNGSIIQSLWEERVFAGICFQSLHDKIMDLIKGLLQMQQETLWRK